MDWANPPIIREPDNLDIKNQKASIRIRMGMTICRTAEMADPWGRMAFHPFTGAFSVTVVRISSVWVYEYVK